jgi:hypothetical protein
LTLHRPHWFALSPNPWTPVCISLTVSPAPPHGHSSEHGGQLWTSNIKFDKRKIQRFLRCITDIKFHKNTFSSSEIVTCRHVDKHGKVYKSIFCDFHCRHTKEKLYCIMRSKVQAYKNLKEKSISLKSALH